MHEKIIDSENWINGTRQRVSSAKISKQIVDRDKWLFARPRHVTELPVL